MADVHYSAKAALYIGLTELASGLISIGIGGFNTREDDHFAILHFKPNGLPVWAGVLYVFSGCVGLLSHRNPRKSLIQIFLGLSILAVVLDVLMFWVLLPILMKGSMSTQWNLFYGSFLAIVSIVFILNLKTIAVCFRPACVQSIGCCDKRRPPDQRSHRNLRLSTLENSLNDTRQTEVSHDVSRDRRVSAETRQHRGRRESRNSQSGSMHHSERRERLQQVARVLHHHEDNRPPPPPYHPDAPISVVMETFPKLPAYSEIDRTSAPPPYSESNNC